MLYSDEEEDNTGEGVAAALQANGESSAAIVSSESTSTPKFSWSGLLAAACYRTFVLTHLGESYCSPELGSESVDPARCCNKCNPALDLDSWMPAIPKPSKITASDIGSPGGVFFQAVCDWADGEVARLYSGDDFIFDLKGGDLMSKEEMIMLQRSVYHVADSKEIRFLQGSNSHGNLLSKLRRSRPDIDSGVDERFRSFVRNDDIVSQLDRVNWGARVPRRKPASAATTCGESTQSSQPRESSSLRQEVAAQPNEVPDDPIPSMSLQTQNDSLCRGLLRSNVERRLAETGSQPSGLRYDMVVRNGSGPETAVENENEVGLSFKLAVSNA